MSPTVNNFVHDLVAMAKAMEDLPVVQAELSEINSQLIKALDHAQQLELTLMDRKREIDALHAKVHAVEAERDDAEMRFLESEDRTRSALDFIKTTFGSAGSLIQALEPPPKVEPVAAALHEETNEQLYAKVTDSTLDQNARTHANNELSTRLGEDADSRPDPMQSQEHSLPVTSFEEVPKSDANPTAAVDTSSQTAPQSPIATGDSAVDDVGYHNEPDVGNDWSAWNAWCERMRQRYGTGAWPQRPDNAAPSVA